MAMRLFLVPERPEDSPRINELMDQGFGRVRRNLPVYSLRAQRAHLPQCSFVALNQMGQARGAIRFWPIRLNGEPKALLLGPLAMHPAHRGLGIASALIKRGMMAAQRSGYPLCFVVGEPRLYLKHGFTNARQLGFRLPLPDSPRKLQLLELTNGALAFWPKGATLGPMHAETLYEP